MQQQRDWPRPIVLANTSTFGGNAYVSLASLALCPEKWVGPQTRLADVVVGRCGPLSGATRRGSVAYCVPPLYGEARSVVLQDVRKHQALGVDHTYIYDTECDVPLNIDPTVTTHLCMPWVHNVRILQRGQQWMNHECLLRAARDGWEWVIAKDVDETIMTSHLRASFAAPEHIPLLRTLARRRDLDVITFGRMYGQKPQCIDNPHMCLKWHGYRKWMARASRVWIARIHFVQTCAPERCRTLDMNSSEIWLNHSMRTRGKGWYRGMPKG
jgi:hypothetical protein